MNIKRRIEKLEKSLKSDPDAPLYIISGFPKEEEADMSKEEKERFTKRVGNVFYRYPEELETPEEWAARCQVTE